MISIEKFGFFNSINSDRVYDAEDFASFFKKFFTNGVFNGGLAVKPGESMNIIVGEGNANINGYGYSNTEDLNLNISIGDSNSTRIDNVVVRLDLENRKITSLIDEGTPSSSPVAPNPQRLTTIYDLVIAQITIPAGTSKIDASMIKDTRFDETLCGIVTGAVKQIETKEVFAQYEAYFNKWFEDLQVVLDGDVATKLAKEIEDLKLKTLTYEDIEEIDDPE